jgi:hypothetical protein
MQAYIRIWTPPDLQAQHGRGKMDRCVRLFDLVWGSDPRVLMSYAPLRLIGLTASSYPGYRQVRQGTVQPTRHQPRFELARKDVSILIRVPFARLLNPSLVAPYVSACLDSGISLPDDSPCVLHLLRLLGLASSRVDGNAHPCGAGPRLLGPSCSPPPHRLYLSRRARQAAESTYSWHPFSPVPG